MLAETPDNAASQLRLLHFLSPALPVGAYSYSQGLEWAVQNEWVANEADFEQWVTEQIGSTLALQELPLLRRLHKAARNNDVAAADKWSQTALAVRDTAEQRQEERDRALAYLRVLDTVTAIDKSWQRQWFERSQLISMAWFSVQHAITESSLVMAFAHNWLESHLITGVKIVPLGQSSAQRLLYELAPVLLTGAKTSMTIKDEDVGISLPALSMASSEHETQYSRVYRS